MGRETLGRHRAAAAGHQIALHSASHEYSGIYQSADAYWQDIELLKLLQTKQGWTRRQLKDFVAAFFKAREGGVESVKNWFSLRRAVQQLLAGEATVDEVLAAIQKGL